MADKSPDDVQARFKIVRTSLGLNQAEFGEKLGLGKAAVSKIEIGGSRLTESTVLLLQSAFGVSRSWILDGVGPMFSSEISGAFSRFASDQNLSPLAQAFISKLLLLTDDELRAVYDFMEGLVDAVRVTGAVQPAPDPQRQDEWTDEQYRAALEEQLALEKKPKDESEAS